MGTMAMDRETELARFMDSHKAQAHYDNIRDKYGGGTSLPLHSDNIEDKRQLLRQERHRDWMLQQEKPPSGPPLYEVPPHAKESPHKPVYYKVGPTEQGLDIGHYDKQREHLNRQRQRDYLEYQKKQREIEDMRRRQRQVTQRQPVAPPPGQVDYDGQAEMYRQEQRKSYQDYQGKYHILQDGPVQPKPLLNYDENRKLLAMERKSEYNEFQRRKEMEERERKLHPPPPENFPGLPIGEYDSYLKENAPKMKMQYKDMLDQQQRDDMYRRVKNEGEMPVIDRMAEEERKRMERSMTERQQDQVPIKKDRFYGAEQYEEYRKQQNNVLGEEYRGYLKEQKEKDHSPYEHFVYPTMASSETPVVESLGREVEQQRRRLREERKRDYERYQLQMKMKENPRRTNAPQASGPYDGIFHGLGDHGNVQEHLAEERKLDLKQHMEKINASPKKGTDENRAHGVPSRPDWALGVGEDRERHRASPARNYDQGFNRPPPRDGPVGYGPSDDYRGGGQGGAPPRAQGGGFRTPNYDEMLNSKRREEAQRRRHDDPEYQMRLTSLDSRDQDQDRDRMRDVQQRQQPMRGY